MSLVIKFYFTSSMLNTFRTLIHPSSGACDFSIVSPHWSCVLVLMCVGVSVWLGWSGIRVADQCGDTIEKSQAPDDGCINVRNMLSIERLLHGYHSNPATPKLQHTSKQEHTTNVVIQ